MGMNDYLAGSILMTNSMEIHTVQGRRRREGGERVKDE
jgi:hypothetical protein